MPANNIYNYVSELDTDCTLQCVSAQNINACLNILINKNSNNNFNIIHTNIRSLQKNFEEFETFMHATNNIYDVICLSETFNIVNLELFKIPGYKIYYNESKQNKNDGVVIYVKDKIHHEAKVINVDNFKFLRITIKNNNNTFAITGMYKSPIYNVNLFNTNLEKYIDRYANADSELFVGDLNINLLAEAPVPEHVSNYLNILANSNYKSLINLPTRIQDKSRTCIDHMFYKSNKQEHLLAIVLEDKITDHFPIILQINKNVQRNPGKDTQNILVLNKEMLKCEATKINWEHEVLNSQDPNQVCENFIKVIKNLINNSTKRKTINSKIKKRKTWITDSLIISINRKNDMYKNCQRNPNNITLKTQYNVYKNLLSSLIKKVKQDYYRNKINENINDSRKIWKISKEYINNNNTNNRNKIDKIVTENRSVSKTKDIANKFNHYFANVGINMRNSIKPDRNYTPIRPKTISNTIFFNPATREEILKHINQLKNNKAHGIDEIRAEHLKIIAEDISEPLKEIINLCFLQGKFPEVLKTSLVTPIYKSGDQKEMSNYRPISLITNITKIVEKCIKSRIIEFIEKYNIISKNQYGFRAGYNTQDAASELTSKIYKALDNSHRCLCIFLDLSKAFDSICHQRLMEKLEKIGFRGIALDIIKSYITNRKQIVKINDTTSEVCELEAGIPQGTVLGPLLFLLYVNDIFLQFSNENIISYADDTVLYVEENSWESIKSKAEDLLIKLKKWLDYNYLKLNIEKTKFIPFTVQKTTLEDFEIILHQQCDSMHTTCTEKIQKATEIKYLGLIIDSNLKWHKQVEYTCNKLRKLLYVFRKLKPILTQKLIKNVYYALVQSIINYGLLVWGGSYKTNLNKIFVLQKIIIKNILGKTLIYPTCKIFNEFSVMTLNQLYALQIFKYYWKNRNDLITIREHQHETRSAARLISTIPLCKKTIGQKNFIFYTIKFYNIIPSEIKSNTTIIIYL